MSSSKFVIGQGAFGGMVLVLVLATRAWAGDFVPLGDLSGGTFHSYATNVSADGSTVVGLSQSSSGLEAFRWTFAGGMQGLGDLAGGAFTSRAFAASADGSVVVGQATTDAGNEAFRWTAGTGMQGLGDLPGGGFDSWAYGISDDGAVVAGQAETADGDEAFRWTSASGMQGLGYLPGFTFGSYSNAMSADGNTIVGHTRDGSGGLRAFRWTDAGGMADIGTVTAGANSAANGVSADGSYVVGRSNGRAFLWTMSDGMESLGELPGGNTGSHALAITEDGSIVVGWSGATGGDTAFIWDSVNGMRSLKVVIESEYGIDLTGWHLTSAEAISPDGAVIVGAGINPDGMTEAWRFTVPEPGGLALLGICSLLLLRRER